MLVALTGSGQEQDHERTREAGFDWHLLKPIDRNELDKVLAASLPGTAELPQNARDARPNPPHVPPPVRPPG